MTERRALAASDLAAGQRGYRATTWRIGLAVLGLGALLSAVAVAWPAGLFGVLAFATVFGGLFWITMRVLRAADARLRGHPLLPRNKFW